MALLARYILAALFLAVLPAGAQTGAPAQPQAPAAKETAPPDTRVRFSGSFRSRFEGWNWFESETADSSYNYLGSFLRFGWNQSLPNVDWQIEFTTPFLLGLPDNAIAAGPQGQLGLGATYFAVNDNRRNVAMTFPRQAFVRFKNLFGDRSHSLRLGRFEFADGAEVTPRDASLAWVKRERINQRLLGPFGWTHVNRAFDGAHYTYNRGKTNVTFVGALPTRGVFQVDGWGNLRVAFGYLSLTRSLQRGNYNAEWRGFGLYYHDWRRVVKTDSRPLALRQRDFGNIRIGTFGGHYISSLKTGAGEFDLLGWGVAQTGRWGSLDHRGAAVAVEGGWQPASVRKWQGWVRGGYFHSSGDGDPLDGKHQTFFQVLPTPRGYARFPFFDMVNNIDSFVQVMFKPARPLQVRVDAHFLQLANRRDLWYLGGGAFQPWSFGYVGRPSGGASSFANLYDASVDYAVNPRLTLSGYFGYARGKSVIGNLHPRGRNGALGYAEVLWRF